MDARGESLHPDELLAELGWVRALARSLVLDPDVTDDVLQQVCLLALQKAPRGARTGPGLRAWLAAVTRSLARRRVRSDVRRRRRELAAAQPEALPSTADLAAHREALQGLVEAVTKLQEPYFSAIIARYFEGLEVADIAARGGTTPAAVRQQLSRARSQLRSRLQRLVAEDRDGWLACALALPSAGAVSKAAPAGADIAHLGGRLVARQAGKGAAAKIAAALVLSLGLILFTWRVFIAAPGAGGTPAILEVPEAARGEGPPAFAVSAPAAEPKPFPARAPAEAAQSPVPSVKAAPVAADVNVQQVFRLVIVGHEARPVGGALVETCVKTGDTPAANPMLSREIFGTVASTLTDSIGRCTVVLSPERFVMISKEGVGSSGRRHVSMLERARNDEGDVVIALLPFLTIQGQVLEADGSPAGGRAVSIRPTGADMITGGPRAAPLITTDADGRFRSLVDHSNQYAVETIGTGLPVGQVVNPKPGETITVNLRLPGDWWIGGTVVDEAGAVVTGARILALHLPDDVPQDDALFVPTTPRESVVTDAAGAFSVGVRDAGTYLVAAFAKGHPMSEPQRVRIEGAQSRPMLALTLEAPASITGSVVGAGGAAAPGASVILEPLPPTMLGDASLFGPYFQGSLVARAGPDGSFSFRKLPARGTFELRACLAMPAGSAPCEAPRVRAVAGAADLVLVAAAGEAPARGSLRVRFRSSPKAPPLAAVRWSVQREGEGTWAIVTVMKVHDHPGQPLDITDLDLEAKYTLAVVADGHGGVDVHDLVPTRDGTDITVELPLQGALVVEVVDARGAPVPHSEVEIRRSLEFLRNPFGGQRTPRSTGSTGSTRFEELDPGSYHVTATSPAGKVEGDVVVGDGETASIRLVAVQR